MQNGLAHDAGTGIPGYPAADAGEGADLTTSSLMWGVLFGAIGLGFLAYGRKQRAAVPLVCGLALMVFPYFVSSTFALVLIGAALMAVPYFLRF